MKLIVTFDERRCGYFVQGLGFDFFAYFTSDFSIDDDTEHPSFIECDSVQRNGDDYTLHLSIPIHKAKAPSPDFVETLIHRELSKFWSI